MNPSEDIFAAVARIAAESQLPVLGGHAVNAYGYTRTTLDADLMVCVDDFHAWRAAFESLGYTWAGQTDAFAKMNPPEDRALPLDIMLVEKPTISKIVAESRLLPFGAARLPVPRPLHLIALKLHAMKNPARLETGKDLPDILHLVQICDIDPKSAEFQKIFHQYGNEQIRSLLRRHLDAAA